MKLSELVNFRNQLFNYSSTVIEAAANKEIGRIMHLMQTQSFVSSNFVNDLQEKHKNIQQTFAEFETSLTATKTHVQELINNAEAQWFINSYERYTNYNLAVKTQRISNDDNTYYDEYGIVRKGINPYKVQFENNFVEQTLNKSLLLSDEIMQLFRTRIMSYSDWHYPAIIIRPGLETFINDMVANDPLYLIDEHLDLLLPCMNKFNETYKRRLCPYVVDNFSTDNSILESLPNNQFAMCLVYNYFDYKPLEIIENYLKEIFKKLRPGGVMVMTFNDCDRPSAVLLVEQSAAFYTPGNKIFNIAKQIGYQEIFRWSNDGPVTWLELKKPGKLTSARGGQTLAKIIHK